MTWDPDKVSSIINNAKGGSNDYLKLKDGGSALIVLLGDPLEYYTTYGDKTEYPDYREGLNFTFKTNVAVLDEPNRQFSIKLLTGKMPTLKIFREVIKEYGADNLFKFTRTGSSNDTKYNLLYKRALNTAEKDAIATLNLFELKLLTGVKTEGTLKDVPF